MVNLFPIDRTQSREMRQDISGKSAVLGPTASS
jgi:hypothetical protein